MLSAHLRDWDCSGTAALLLSYGKPHMYPSPLAPSICILPTATSQLWFPGRGHLNVVYKFHPSFVLSLLPHCSPLQGPVFTLFAGARTTCFLHVVVALIFDQTCHKKFDSEVLGVAGTYYVITRGCSVTVRGRTWAQGSELSGDCYHLMRSLLLQCIRTYMWTEKRLNSGVLVFCPPVCLYECEHG